MNPPRSACHHPVPPAALGYHADRSRGIMVHALAVVASDLSGRGESMPQKRRPDYLILRICVVIALFLLAMTGVVEMSIISARGQEIPPSLVGLVGTCVAWIAAMAAWPMNGGKPKPPEKKDGEL